MIFNKTQYTGIFPELPDRGYFAIGDNGPQVWYLEMFLNWAVNAKIMVGNPVDGVVMAGVIRFQKRSGLEPTGKFGRDELAAAKDYKK